jgi:hypothetical protein
MQQGRRGNPNWGKQDMVPTIPTVTEFEKKVIEFNLQPDEYVRSEPLRAWAAKNKNLRYIPEPLLAAWGFAVEGE